jgi:preprotein translocase subunit YajC
MLFAATTAKSSGSSAFILIYLVLFAAFYFLYLRPRNRRQREARSQARQVEVGERVRTIGGLVATMIAKADDLVTLRTDSGVELTFLPSAIAGRFDPLPPASETPPEEGHGEESGAGGQ